MLQRRFSSLAYLTLMLTSAPALAQCDEWIPTAGNSEWGSVIALGAIDHDGPGPQTPRLYGASNQAFERTFSYLRFWTGSSWQPVPQVTYSVSALLPLPQSVGGLPAGSILVAGDSFAGTGAPRVITAWDGQTLSLLGPNTPADFSAGANILALTTWDPDGDGPQSPWIIAGGVFGRIGGVNASCIAAWDGAQWRALGPGLEQVNALASFDPDGPGPGAPILVAATQSSTSSSFVKAWNGVQWQQLGPTFNAPVSALTLHDADGDGPLAAELYAGGRFLSTAGLPASRVARWDGTGWVQAGSAAPNPSLFVYALRSHDPDGPGPLPARLIAAGDSSKSLSVLVGNTWVPEYGCPSGGTLSNAGIRALEAFDPDGDGPRGVELVASGGTAYISATSVQSSPRTNYLAYAGPGAWDGQRWGPLGSEITGGKVLCIYAHTGAGDADGVYASGTFTAAGGNLADGLAKWDGQRWVGLGTPSNSEQSTPRTVGSLTSYDPDGPGPQASWLVGTDARNVGVPFALMRWDGAAWVRIGNFTSGSGVGRMMMTFDEDGPGASQPRLFAAGGFTNPSSSVLVFNGTSWVSAGASSGLRLLFAHDEDGPGPGLQHLYAVGDSINAIMRWNGAAWTQAASCAVANSASWYAASWDRDGNGPSLPEIVIGATLVTAQGSNFFGACAFDGTQWRQLGPSLNVDRTIRGLGIHDPDGNGPVTPQLFIGYSVGNSRAIQRLSKNTWADLGAGLHNAIDNSDPWITVAHAITTIDPDGDGPLPPELWIGGEFTHAGGQPARNFARWRFASLPPAIAQHPQSATSCSFEPRTLTAQATQTTGLTYQWRTFDSSITTRWRPIANGPLVVNGQQIATVSGATTSTLTVIPFLGFSTQSFSCSITNACGSAETSSASLAAIPCCGSADFNNDGDFGTNADIEAFFACLAGNCCPTCFPLGADFNADGDTGTDADIEAFFRVLAGGNC